jgi:hypothetical protein
MPPSAGPALVRRARLSEEGRKNLMALLIAFVALAAMVAFALRPAAILPVGTAAVEGSLENQFGDGNLFGDSDRGDPVCEKVDAGFACTVTVLSDSDTPDSLSTTDPTEYMVRVGGLGCWTAVSQTSRDRPARGCISILDYFGY